MRRSQAFVPCALSLAALALLVSARNVDPQAPAPARQKAAVVQPAFTRAELAGRYYQGDGLGVNLDLRLAADGTFKFVWRGCLGEYDKNGGTWWVEGDVVVMNPEKPHEQHGFKGMDTRFVPVPWGERMYLVDEEGVPGFAAAAAEQQIFKGDGLHGSDYVRHVDHKLPPLKGEPQLPARYRHFFERGPIHATVVDINQDGTVTLDKGSADRVTNGLLLASSSYATDGSLEVIAVSTNTSVARPFYYWNEEKPVQVGQKFTTG